MADQHDHPLPMHDWRAEAACKGRRDLFARDDTGPLAVNDPARLICRRCPVRDACLADALATDPFEDHDIRGGYSRSERLAMRSGRRPRRTATERIWDVICDGEWRTVSQIADRAHCTTHHARQQLQALGRVGVVESMQDPWWHGVGSPRKVYRVDVGEVS